MKNQKTINDETINLRIKLTDLLHSNLYFLKKSAFTLSEVLITLGIIGIIAAMTLPTLIQKYQSMVIKQRFKKAYSTILQAYTKATYDLGENTNCHYGVGGGGHMDSECNIFREAVEKNYNIAKVCRGNALKDGCLPNYKDQLELGLTAGCAGNYKRYLDNDTTVYNLTDGTIIMLYAFGTDDKGTPVIIHVDVNGKSGPNKWGYDLFSFSLRYDEPSAVKLEPEGCALIEKGGKFTNEMLLSN